MGTVCAGTEVANLPDVRAPIRSGHYAGDSGPGRAVGKIEPGFNAPARMGGALSASTPIRLGIHWRARHRSRAGPGPARRRAERETETHRQLRPDRKCPLSAALELVRAGPDHTLVLLCNWAETHVYELLQTFSFVGLCRINVTGRVGRDAVGRRRTGPDSVRHRRSWSGSPTSLAG